MRPWTELTELVSREEARLGLLPAEASSATPSARLLAIVSSLRAIAAHEAQRTQTAEAALARAELACERLRDEAAAQEAIARTAQGERAELLEGLAQLLRVLEARKRRAIAAALPLEGRKAA